VNDSYIVFVSLLVASSADKIVAALVRKDYGVRPGKSDGRLTSSGPDEPCATLILELHPYNKRGPSDVAHDLRTIIDRKEIKVFGFVIIPGVEGITWGGSNIQLSQPKPRKLVGETAAPALRLVDGGKGDD